MRESVTGQIPGESLRIAVSYRVVFCPHGGFAMVAFCFCLFDGSLPSFQRHAGQVRRVPWFTDKEHVELTKLIVNIQAMALCDSNHRSEANVDRMFENRFSGGF